MKEKINIAGIEFDAVTYGGVLAAIEVFVKQEGKKHFITTPNPEMLVFAQKNEEYKKTLNQASMAVPDGIGILWAAHYLALPKSDSRITEVFKLLGSLFKVIFRSKSIQNVLPTRVTGTDLLFKIVDESQKTGWRIFLLGAAPGVASVAVDRLVEQYPEAIFAGNFAGTPAESHEDDLCNRINSSNPDILFVAYGNPAQEEWILRNLHKLNSVKVAIGVGGAIDFAAGRAKRAPKFMQALGLEWLWRLIKEPKRIKRIWNATVVFILLIFKLKNSSK